MRFRLLICRAITAAACGGVTFGASSASAQNLDPVAATELFSQGRDALKDGDAERACPLFAESNRLDPKVGTLMNLGECEEQRGHLAEALQAWQQAINLADATNDPRRAFAVERHERIAPRVPRLTIRLSHDSPAGTRVFRDDVELGTVMLGRPFPVDPGDHRIEAVGPDNVKRTFRVRLKEGDATEIAVSARAVAPSPRPPADAPPPVDTSTGTKRTLAYVLGGVGIAGIATGLVTGAMIMSRKSTVDEHCGPDGACDPAGVDAADSGKTLVPVNTVAWAVGAVGLGAGAYFFFTSTSTPPPQGATAPHRDLTGAVLHVGGTF